MAQRSYCRVAAGEKRYDRIREEHDVPQGHGGQTSSGWQGRLSSGWGRRPRLGDKWLAFRLNLGRQSVPVVETKNLGDQLKIIAVGQANALGLQFIAQRLRHGLGV